MDLQNKTYVENLFTKKEGFIKYNHMYLISLEEEHLEVGVDLNKDTENPNHTTHGGLIFSLADTAMGLHILARGKKCVTINASINYIRPGVGKKLIACATPVKRGKTIEVYNTEIKDEQNNLIAVANGSYFIISEEENYL